MVQRYEHLPIWYFKDYIFFKDLIKLNLNYTWANGTSFGKLFWTSIVQLAGSRNGQKSQMTPPIWFCLTNKGTCSLACPINKTNPMFNSPSS